MDYTWTLENASHALHLVPDVIQPPCVLDVKLTTSSKLVSVSTDAHLNTIKAVLNVYPATLHVQPAQLDPNSVALLAQSTLSCTTVPA